ncbi:MULTISPECIES: RNA polymerase sigma factor [Bradyrhizobium]|jgi:RNA polymerase sigma-70 factor (ECF subfamily)|uniref:RNA polymerase sigma factor n=1 Tax=Bradyrhizobium TaxID=374 RepID=UPI0003A6DBE5|nr:RNA polymerase sigma factor [Bradyrhizobium denitrificans]MCL8483168.1 RNA polymerase sigma factor [Bradyrhizobium denitrificans]RTL96027.1 MAG: RNA polymerase sigma factor [Bradyrhizobiaceae bacterium]
MPWTTTASAVPSGEDDLIRRARARDEAAIRAILQANNRRLFRIARGILRNDSEAEDVVQDTYVRALTHLGEFRGQSSLSTWLVRIAMNEAMGRLRGARPALPLDEQREDKSGAEVIEFRATSNDPEKSVAQRQIQAVVEQAIDDLSEPFRLVFIARVIEEMSIDETADLLGLKPETVKTRLHRARGMLRVNVEKEIGPVLLDAFPFAGQRCERLTDAVLRRLGLST